MLKWSLNNHAQVLTCWMSVSSTRAVWETVRSIKLMGFDFIHYRGNASDGPRRPGLISWSSHESSDQWPAAARRRLFRSRDASRQNIVRSRAAPGAIRRVQPGLQAFLGATAEGSDIGVGMTFRRAAPDRGARTR